MKIDGEGLISFIYKNNEDILEYKKEDIIGKNIISMLFPDEIDNYFKFLSTNETKEMNHKLILKSGSIDIISIKYTSNFILLFQIKKSSN